MAKQLEGVSERILACAKAEFLDKGYTDASLRAIAAAAETSTNSIYVRFKDKEGLFSAIVEPVLSTMLERFIHIQEDFHRMDSSVQAENMAEYAGNGTMELVNYMYDHLDEFRLLLDASYGTRFHNFVDELAQVGTTVGQVDEILKAEEQLHAETPVSFNGYDTVVGGGGAHLSGGERQRIAIARAMLKDAPVVVLDEATAYIDPENEAVIQRAVAKLVADKTVIVIAHRLSTITGAAKSGGHVFLLISRGYIPMFCLCGPYEAYRPQHICRECGSRSRRTRRAYPARRHW